MNSFFKKKKKEEYAHYLEYRKKISEVTVKP